MDVRCLDVSPCEADQLAGLLCVNNVSTQLADSDLQSETRLIKRLDDKLRMLEEGDDERRMNPVNMDKVQGEHHSGLILDPR